MNTITPKNPMRDYRLEKEAAEQAEAKRLSEHMKAQEQAKRFEATVKTVPDDLFADDPELEPLRADLEVKARRALNIVNSIPIRVNLNKRMQALKEQIEAATTEQRLAIVDDALDGAEDFPTATALGHRIEWLKQQLVFVQHAHDVLINAHRQGDAFKDAHDRAARALSDALMDKKRQHLRDHPELVG